MYVLYNAEDLSSAREQHVADQLVTLTRLLERLPPERRAQAAHEISDYSLQLSIDSAPRVAENDAWESDVRGLRQLLGFAIGTELNQGILADYREIAADDLSLVPQQDMPEREILAQRVAKLFRFREDVLVSIHLEGDQWLNALVPGPAFAGFFNQGLVPSVLLMAAATLVLVAWLIGRPLAALSRFADAVESAGARLSRREPLPEEGPPELRRAARAFNAMQARIQSLVGERTRMVTTMSQDLRAPLARMRLRADYVDNRREREQMLKDIEDMESMLASAAELADAEIADQPRFRVDLCAMLEDLTRELDLPAPQVNLHGVTDLQYSCVPSAMRRAFQHLLANAAAYGGKARAAVELRPDEVLVLVDDDGPGVPEHERENCFLPFYRLEPARIRNTGGFGIGLSAARAVMRAHGGEVCLATPPGGRGTRVRVSLPISGMVSSAGR